MRTVVKNAVSTRLIRRILQRDIAKRTQKMSDAEYVVQIGRYQI